MTQPLQCESENEHGRKGKKENGERAQIQKWLETDWLDENFPWLYDHDVALLCAFSCLRLLLFSAAAAAAAAAIPSFSSSLAVMFDTIQVLKIAHLFFMLLEDVREVEGVGHGDVRRGAK
jgi:hypothetical protein